MEKVKEFIYNKYNNKKDLIIIEAGAAEGNDTLDFSNLFPNAKIFSFEPDPVLYDMAYQKVHNRNNVKLFNMALAEKDGEMEMSIADRFGQPWGSGSLLKPKLHLHNNPDITFNKKITVKTINLDNFISKENITDIGLLWLDLQGYEPIVLKSSPFCLKIAKHIFTEYHLVENYENNILYSDYKLFLESNNYKLLFEHSVLNPQNEVDGGDAFFEKIL